MAARSHSLTVLSAGLLIYDVLSTDAGLLAAGCRKVFPVVSEEGAQLSDAEETWADGAYIQTLTFTIGI